MDKNGKILKITGDTVTIGLADGSIQEVRPSDLNFVPSVGDKVEVFGSETALVISKLEEEKTPQQEAATNAININIDQSGNPVATGAGGGKVVSKVAYVLLAIFLGGVGAHKFYAGKTGAGVVYLLFCWTFVPAVIALVEGIIALTKTADANGNIVI